MNLNKELEQLAQLGEIAKSAIAKVQLEIEKIDTKESEILRNFVEEAKEGMSTGKGLDELKQKLENYASNQQENI